MKCPICGNEMEKGEMQSPQLHGHLFWAPADYFHDKAFPNTVRRKTIERGGGIVVDVRNRVFHQPTRGYACRACQVVLIDCKHHD